MGTTTALTPDDLVKMPPREDGKDYELSGGELIVVGKAGWRHETVKSRILEALYLYRERNRIGDVFAESLFTLDQATARMPDAAFVGLAKLKSAPQTDLAIPFAPDIAIEVISNSETAADAEKKLAEYLAAGVLEVWQFYPGLCLVRVRTKAGSRDLEGEELLETPVLPGFRVAVNIFFEP